MLRLGERGAAPLCPDVRYPKGPARAPWTHSPALCTSLGPPPTSEASPRRRRSVFPPRGARSRQAPAGAPWRRGPQARPRPRPRTETRTERGTSGQACPCQEGDPCSCDARAPLQTHSHPRANLEGFQLLFIALDTSSRRVFHLDPQLQEAPGQRGAPGPGSGQRPPSTKSLLVRSSVPGSGGPAPLPPPLRPFQQCVEDSSDVGETPSGGHLLFQDVVGLAQGLLGHPHFSTGF